MKTVIYAGRHGSGVDVVDPQTGREIGTNVAVGDSLNVPDHIYDEFMQGDQWKDGEAKKPAPKPAAKKESN